MKEKEPDARRESYREWQRRVVENVKRSGKYRPL